MSRALFTVCVIGTLLIGATACQAPKKEDTGAKEATTYILVRHAEKADDGTEDPPLTELGKQRAERLAKMLSSADVSAIYSTDYRRNRQTAMPLAKELNLNVTAYRAWEQEDFMRIQQEAIGKTIVIVGHSNTVPPMVNQLLGRERFQELEENEYDKLFIVTRIGDLAGVAILNF